jgi:membrane-bound lytic murein transglycosylase A
MDPLLRRRLRWSCLIVFIGVLAACAPMRPVSVEAPALMRVSIRDYPRFEDSGGFKMLDNSIAQSLNYLHKLPPERSIAFGRDTYTVAHLIESLEDFRRLILAAPSPSELNRAIRSRYHVYRAAGLPQSNDVLFTGYYEPLLEGSRRASRRFSIPVYGRPADLVDIDLSLFAADLAGRRIQGRYTNGRVVPYPTRGEIRRMQDFDKLAPPVAWLKDEVDLLVLQIQGSGKIRVENGDILHIQFDSSNGRPYQSIGRRLIDQGRITAQDMSMPAIRSYLQQHPELIGDILDHNPRYIFFKKAGRGPRGALGVPLTPLRSLAVDRRIFPSAALAFFSTRFPQVNAVGNIEQWGSYSSFALTQDAGSAITGPGRVDIFMGAGRTAEVAAGHLKHHGRLHFLVLKSSDK